MSVWRRNPGYKPEWLDDNEPIEARDISGTIYHIGKASDYEWNYDNREAIWILHEYRLLSDDPEQGDGCHSQSEKPSEIVAQSDLEVCLRHIKESIGTNELAVIISNNEYMIEYRECMYTCKDEVTAIELINTFVKAEKYYVG